MTQLKRSMFSTASLEIIRGAHQAFNKMDKNADKNWENIKLAGAGFIEMRRLAMVEAGTNRPYGRAYTAAYGRLLEASKLDERIKDKGDRQKLIELMDNLPAIEDWRATLPKEDRRRWNHPTTIFRHWKATQKATRRLFRPSASREEAGRRGCSGRPAGRQDQRERAAQDRCRQAVRCRSLAQQRRRAAGVAQDAGSHAA
jgi:hypothetical protein